MSGWDEAEHPRDEAGRFTESWAASLAATLPHRFMTHAQVAHYADRTDFTRTYFHGGGSSITAVRTYSDGKRMLEKHHLDDDEQADTEIAVSYIAAVVGAPVPASVLLPETDEDGNIGTLSEHIEGDVAVSLLPSWSSVGIDEFHRQEGALAALHQNDKLGLLDALVGPSDRHAGNWIVTPSGAVGIDYANAAFAGYADSPFARYLEDRQPHDIPVAELDRIERGIMDLHDMGIVLDSQKNAMVMVLRRLRASARQAPGGSSD